MLANLTAHQIITISSFGPSSPYPSHYQPPQHISHLEYSWGPGSTVRRTFKLSQIFHPRAGGFGTMVKGSKDYESYFARSSGQSNGSKGRASGTPSPRLLDKNGKLDCKSQDNSRKIAHSTTLTVNTHASSVTARGNHNQPRTSGSTSSSDESDYLDSPRSVATSISSASEDLMPQELLGRRKREMLDKLMTEFYAFFGPWLEETTGVECYGDGDCQDDEGGSGSGGGGGSRGASGGGSRGAGGGSDGAKRSLAGKKRQQRDSDEGESDDRLGGGGAGGSGGGGDRTKRAKRMLFACPFFKRYPDQFQNVKTCCGPGWSEIHRLKEHLYRRHMLPRFMCKRCLSNFDTDALLDAHQRSETPCMLKRAGPEERRFNQAVEAELRRRKMKGSEREKWEEVYMILFPGASLPASPYYDGNHSSANELAEYGEFLRRELPHRVRRSFQDEIDRRLAGLIDENMRAKIVDIIQELNLELLRCFKKEGLGDGGASSRGGSPPPLPNGGAGTGGGSEPQALLLPDSSGIPGMEALAIPNDFFDNWLNMDAGFSGANGGSFGFDLPTVQA